MPPSDLLSGSLTSPVSIYLHYSEVVPFHASTDCRHNKVEIYPFSVMKMLENITIITQYATYSALGRY